MFPCKLAEPVPNNCGDVGLMVSESELSNKKKDDESITGCSAFQHTLIRRLWYVAKSSGEIYGDHVVVFGMTFEGLPLHVDISTASYASLIRLVKFSCRFPESTHSICDKTHSRRFYVPKLISERKADFETR